MPSVFSLLPRAPLPVPPRAWPPPALLISAGASLAAPFFRTPPIFVAIPPRRKSVSAFSISSWTPATFVSVRSVPVSPFSVSSCSRSPSISVSFQYTSSGGPATSVCTVFTRAPAVLILIPSLQVKQFKA